MLREQEFMDAYSNDIILYQLNLLLLQLQQGGRVSQGREAANRQRRPQRERDHPSGAAVHQRPHPGEAVGAAGSPGRWTSAPAISRQLFHKNLQISPGEYIRRIKLQESKQMIRENDLNFTEIAAQLHYSTVHHFSRQFKEKFGITPTEYAKSVR